MISFLHPAMLLAALGLLVPLAIHLWNRRRRRVLRIGSIALLEQAVPRRMRNIRFSDLPLFILRSLMLLCFVFLLAGLRFHRPDAASTDTAGWILVDPVISPAEQQAAGLGQDRYQNREVRMLAPGFPSVADSISPPDSPIDYGSYLRELARQHNRPDSVILLGRPYEAHFSGDPPGLPFHVRWWLIPEKDPRARFIQDAFLRDDQTIQLSIGAGEESGIFYRHIRLPFDSINPLALPEELGEVRITRDSLTPSWLLSVSGRIEESFPLKPFQPLHIAWHASPDQRAEMRYLLAALEAVREYSGRPLQWEEITGNLEKPREGQKPDWLFWLSEDDIPAAWDSTNQLIWNPQHMAARLLQATPAGHFSGKNQRYHLTRHLDPRLAPLPTDLPRQMIHMLWPDRAAKAISSVHDRRLVDYEQVQTIFRAAKQESVNPAEEAYAVDHPLWWLLLVLFLAERIWSLHKQLTPEAKSRSSV
jgi:hypothetical protein